MPQKSPPRDRPVVAPVTVSAFKESHSKLAHKRLQNLLFGRNSLFPPASGESPRTTCSLFPFVGRGFTRLAETRRHRSSLGLLRLIMPFSDFPDLFRRGYLGPWVSLVFDAVRISVESW